MAQFMMYLAAIAAALLLATTQAGKTYLARFEVPNTERIGSGLPVLKLDGSVPGMYKGLHRANFHLPTYSDLYAAGDCYGICSTSYPYQVVATGPATISTPYRQGKNKHVQHFDLHSFAAGCMAVTPGGSPQSTPPQPASCKITLRGQHDYAAHLRIQKLPPPVYTIASFNYTLGASPDGVAANTSAPMDKFTLSAEFYHMREIEFSAELIEDGFEEPLSEEAREFAPTRGTELHPERYAQRMIAELHIDDVKFEIDD